MSSDANGQTSASGPHVKKADAKREVGAPLRALDSVLDDFQWPDRRAFVAARRQAHTRALQLLGARLAEEPATVAPLLVATELFRAVSVQLASSPKQAARLVKRLGDVAGVSTPALARGVLAAPELLALERDEAVRVQLGMLMVFAPLRSASLWTHDGGERLNCVLHIGDGYPSRGVHQVARALLAGEPIQSSARRVLLGIAVGRAERPVGALVGCSNPGAVEASRALMQEAVPTLAGVCQREMLISEKAASERALVEASERKLVRLGFDLHDGPIQDVAVIADDLRLFRDQLELVLGPLEQRQLVRGRIEDLDAQLAALDAQLRRLSGAVQAASALLSQPFRAALRERVSAFTARTGIKPRVTLAGNMKLLSTSQQIALLNIVQEALSNIREHAQATAVSVSLSARVDGIEAKVQDNGRGFEIEPTLTRAAREGRIGLLAMNERVRLLGGHCRIDSRAGGPTIVSVALDRWLPPQSKPGVPRKRRRAAAPASSRARKPSQVSA